MFHKIKQATEPLQHDIPTKPCCSLMLDNFEYKGSLYLIIYDRFTRFIVVKKCADLSVHSTILSFDVPTKPCCSLTLDNFEYKGSLYLIIYDRFTRFIVVKKCADLSVHSAILSLLEVFSEHGVPSNIHSDRDRNFMSKEFDTFCKDLGIDPNFSSGYHHSAN